jgi:acetoin utilization deacetylase AcuC-like enzyme
MDRRRRALLLLGLGAAAAIGAGWWLSRARSAERTRVRLATSLPVFYGEDYVVSAHSFDTTRKARWVAESLTAEPIPGVRLSPNAPLGSAELERVHDPAYVAAVRTGEPRALAESNGFAWDPQLWTMVRASNGGAVAAALAALRSGCAGALASGLHHARRAHGAGFCTFNGLALAALAALDAGAKRVLVLDLDAHCGGGTDELVGRHPGVRILDIAVNAFDQYPPAPGNSLDLVASAGDYLPTLERRLQELANEHFDLCLYNAGMDPHQDCPVGGLAGIDAMLLARRERAVFDWCRGRALPVAFVLAGGYIGPSLERSELVALHRLTLHAAAGA